MVIFLEVLIIASKQPKINNTTPTADIPENILESICPIVVYFGGGTKSTNNGEMRIQIVSHEF